MKKRFSTKISSELVTMLLLAAGLMLSSFLAGGLMGCGPAGLAADSNVVHLPLPGLKADGLATVEVDPQRLEVHDGTAVAVFANPYQAIGFELRVDEPSRFKLMKDGMSAGMLNQISVWGPLRATGKASADEMSYGDVPVISAKETIGGWLPGISIQDGPTIDNVKLLEGTYLVVVSTSTDDFDPRAEGFDGTCGIKLSCLAGGCLGEILPTCMPDENETTDEHQDNDSCRNAAPTTHAHWPCYWGICDSFYFSANTHARAEEDVYLLDFVDRWWQLPFSFDIKLTYIPEGQDYDLYLYKGLDNCEKNIPIASSKNSSNQDERISFEGTLAVDDSGLFYVRVVPRISQPCSEPYHLEISFL